MKWVALGVFGILAIVYGAALWYDGSVSLTNLLVVAGIPLVVLCIFRPKLAIAGVFLVLVLGWVNRETILSSVGSELYSLVDTVSEPLEPVGEWVAKNVFGAEMASHEEVAIERALDKFLKKAGCEECSSGEVFEDGELELSGDGLRGNEVLDMLCEPVFGGLRVLEIRDTDLSGRIPDCFFDRNRFRKLEHLDLSRNEFTTVDGGLVEKFASADGVRHLDITWNCGMMANMNIEVERESAPGQVGGEGNRVVRAVRFLWGRARGLLDGALRPGLGLPSKVQAKNIQGLAVLMMDLRGTDDPERELVAVLKSLGMRDPEKVAAGLREQTIQWEKLDQVRRCRGF